jgi:hypothetical protein
LEHYNRELAKSARMIIVTHRSNISLKSKSNPPSSFSSFGSANRDVMVRVAKEGGTNAMVKAKRAKLSKRKNFISVRVYKKSKQDVDENTDHHFAMMSYPYCIPGGST